jgi:hypothetical protein
MVIELVVGGIAAGAVRGVLGLSKYIASTPKKKRKIRLEYLLSTLLSASVIGVLAGIVIYNNVIFAFLAGYAVTDFIEGVFRTAMKKRNWVD